VKGILTIAGGNKHLREIAEKTITTMMKEMMPRIRAIHIDVTIKKGLQKEGGIGFCTDLSDSKNRYFEIEIEKELGLCDFVTALCHEMVHVKQGVRGELTEKLGAQMWKGKDHTDTDYYDQPWEKEAYRMEGKLAKLVWETAL